MSHTQQIISGNWQDDAGEQGLLVAPRRGEHGFVPVGLGLQGGLVTPPGKRLVVKHVGTNFNWLAHQGWMNRLLHKPLAVFRANKSNCGRNTSGARRIADAAGHLLARLKVALDGLALRLTGARVLSVMRSGYVFPVVAVNNGFLHRLAILLSVLTFGNSVFGASLSSSHQAWTNSTGNAAAKFIAFWGDSTMAGYSHYDPGYPTFVPSGDINANVARVVELQSTNQIVCTNYGVSGAQAPFCESLAPTVLISKPKYAVLRVGINDLASASVWSDIKPNYDAIRLKCIASNAVLVVSETWPSGLATASAITNFLNSMRAWCVASNVHLIQEHDWMGSTTNMAVIKPDWTDDGTHPTTNGVARSAEIILGKIRAIEGGLPHVYNAEDVSRIGVGVAVGVSTNTDTIAIPAGAAEWTSALTWNAGTTLQGAGTNSTFITNNASDYLIQLTLENLKTNRLAYIHFTGPGIYAQLYAQGTNHGAGRLRVDHCAFMYAAGAALKLDTVFGVFDHNYLRGNAPGNKLGHLKGSKWGGLSSGNGAWTNATPRFGTEDFFFFEDNDMGTTNQASIMSLLDAQAGARYVFRHNTNYVAYVEGHGSEASYERSTHAVEIYNNYFNQSNVNSVVSFFRGGSGLIFSNAISGVNGVVNPLKLEDNRKNDSLFQPFGGADGRNHWDVNDAGNPLATATVSSAVAHAVTVTGAGWTPSAWIGHAIRRTSGKAATVTRSAGTITVSATSHGFVTGDLVSLFGADQQEYNRIYTITVTDANTFTADIGESRPTTPATGTIKAAKGTHFAEITANTADTITFAASIYEAITTNYCLTLYAGETFEINKVTHAMDQAGRTGGSLIDSTATPAFPAGWNDQTTYPWRQWNNNLGSQGSIAFQAVQASIIGGLHYTNDVELAGYTPYTYPHPMIAETGGSEGGGAVGDGAKKLHGNFKLNGNGRLK